jgi:hypothetical protein
MTKEITSTQDLENVIENYDTFTTYVLEQDTHVENVTIELIGILYGLDDDDLSTDYFINIIERTLDLHRAYMRRNQL